MFPLRISFVPWLWMFKFVKNQFKYTNQKILCQKIYLKSCPGRFEGVGSLLGLILALAALEFSYLLNGIPKLCSYTDTNIKYKILYLGIHARYECSNIAEKKSQLLITCYIYLFFSAMISFSITRMTGCNQNDQNYHLIIPKDWFLIP